MKKFKRMNTMVKPDGSEMTVEEYSKTYYHGRPLKVYKNDAYIVHKIDWMDDWWWLSIKRLDRDWIHDWRELQIIKTELVGHENEGMELYPAESRLMDSANQYHLWVHKDKGFRFPFGWDKRVVEGPEEAAKAGARQRPFQREGWLGKLLKRGRERRFSEAEAFQIRREYYLYKGSMSDVARQFRTSLATVSNIIDYKKTYKDDKRVRVIRNRSGEVIDVKEGGETHGDSTDGG